LSFQVIIIRIVRELLSEDQFRIPKTARIVHILELMAKLDFAWEE
jgi:hypothetical protein